MRLPARALRLQARNVAHHQNRIARQHLHRLWRAAKAAITCSRSPCRRFALGYQQAARAEVRARGSPPASLASTPDRATLTRHFYLGTRPPPSSTSPCARDLPVRYLRYRRALLAARYRPKAEAPDRQLGVRIVIHDIDTTAGTASGAHQHVKTVLLQSQNMLQMALVKPERLPGHPTSAIRN